MEWQVYKLGDICNIEKGITGITKAIAGDYPMVALGEERRTHNEYQFDDEAVIIPLVSSTGHGHRSMKRIHFQSGKFALGSILCAVIPKNKNQVSAQFLYRYLDLNKEQELVSRMKGMANVTLPMNAIAEVNIPLPTIEEQLEIVEKFDLIEKSNQMIEKEFSEQIFLLTNLRQQIQQDALQGKLVPQNPNDEPASKLIESIKAEKEILVKLGKIKKERPLPLIKPEEIPFHIPNEWVWCRLGTLTNYGSSSKADTAHISEDTWVLDLEDIEKETSKLVAKVRYYERKALSTKSIFAKGDVLYSKLRPYLDKVIIADEDGVCTTEILPLKCYGGLNPSYFKVTLKSKNFLSYVNSVTKGMKMPRLGTKEGELALIPIAPIDEQHRIVEKIDQLMQFCDELENTIHQNLTNTQELLKVALKEILTPQVFSL